MLLSQHLSLSYRDPLCYGEESFLVEEQVFQPDQWSLSVNLESVESVERVFTCGDFLDEYGLAMLKYKQPDPKYVTFLLLLISLKINSHLADKWAE